MAAGTASLTYGLARSDIARTLGGACLTTIALTLLTLITIKRWTTNTACERERLADAIHEVEAEKARYVAGQAALEMERQRVQRDAAAERAALAARTSVERQALHDEFEAQRAELVCTTLEAAAKLVRKLDADATPTHEHAVVTHLFPHQQPERVRDRGAR